MSSTLEGSAPRRERKRAIQGACCRKRSSAGIRVIVVGRPRATLAWSGRGVDVTKRESISRRLPERCWPAGGVSSKKRSRVSAAADERAHLDVEVLRVGDDVHRLAELPDRR